MVSILGAGLLVGTALAVIIPEGIRALFTGGIDNEKESHSMSFCICSLMYSIKLVFQINIFISLQVIYIL